MAHPSTARPSAGPWLLILALASACGGGGTSPTPPPPPPPPPGPTPVASVALDQSDLGMVPQFTVQLAATPKDAGGAALTGRTVTWQSSAGTVASVSTGGLVTALTMGTAVITATSEGRGASANVTVREGAVIGPAGGVVVAGGGNVRITIPAGALATTLPISVTPVPAPPSTEGVVVITSYELGPTGTTFATPVQLEFSYPPSQGVDTAQAFYRISRYTDGKWMPLPGSTGGQPGSKVTASTSSFSLYGIAVALGVPASFVSYGSMIITPVLPEVFVGQSVSLTAALDPRNGDWWLPDPQLTRVTRTWSVSSPNVSVSQTGIVTGIIPAASVHVSVMERLASVCVIPCFIGSSLFDGEYREYFIDSLYVHVPGMVSVKVHLVPVSVVTVTPPAPQLPIGQTVQLTANLKDAGGAALSPEFRTVVWSTSNAAVASVSQAGLVTSVTPGSATITADVDGITGSTLVTVTASTNPVVSVTITPLVPTIEVGETLALTATPRDAGGQPVGGRPVTWLSLNPDIATVSQSGLITGVAPGGVAIGATVDGVPAGVFVTVVLPYPLVLGRPAVGWQHSCLLRTDTTIWCWGSGSEGQLGNGGTTAAVFTPGQVSGGGSYSILSAGTNHNCALKADGSAWCWGQNGNGQLGNNSLNSSPVPTAVTGGPLFARIYAGSAHSCALEADGTPWCWGAGVRVGDGTNLPRLEPVQVVGGHKFTALALGEFSSCGLTGAGAAWCWGAAPVPTIGDGTSFQRTAPVQVVGGHLFIALAPGGSVHHCGLKANGEVWCWGGGTLGQLGDGSLVNRTAPVQVASTVKFTALAAGSEHTCGLAEDQTAWCWGLRGNVGSANQLALPLGVTTPIAVFGGRQFTEISANGHTCARAVDGTWCWGGTTNVGQLGAGPNPGSGPLYKVRFP